jgi:hypothetical protein
MKEETGVTPRSQRPRIDIGRSLSIGKASVKASEPAQTPQNAEPAKSSEQSSDAAKVSLSKIFEGVTVAAPNADAPLPPQPVTTGREAAKSQYLKQSATPVQQSTQASISETSAPPSDPDISAVLREIESRLGQYEITDEEDVPKGDTVETLEPYARKYVAFLEQTGQSFSSTEREAKVKEVTQFYSAPTRQGRLQSLVQDI